eukprot:7377582-Prymnesium_polylepis.1
MPWPSWALGRRRRAGSPRQASPPAAARGSGAGRPAPPPSTWRGSRARSPAGQSGSIRVNQGQSGSTSSARLRAHRVRRHRHDLLLRRLLEEGLVREEERHVEDDARCARGARAEGTSAPRRTTGARVRGVHGCTGRTGTGARVHGVH